jgi:hypothetical protein
MSAVFGRLYETFIRLLLTGRPLRVVKALTASSGFLEIKNNIYYNILYYNNCRIFSTGTGNNLLDVLVKS